MYNNRIIERGALINAFDHLADIAALLLEMLQLLAKHSHFGVQLVPLGLQ